MVQKALILGISIMEISTLTVALSMAAQQPQEPVNLAPIDGQSYVLVNQQSGLQVDGGASTEQSGAATTLETRNFSSLTQRWAMTRLPNGQWAVSNAGNGLCLDVSGATVVQKTCALTLTSQQWTLTAATNGYQTLTNHNNREVLDVAGGAGSAGTGLTLSAPGSSPTQSQQWLLRPAFLRGIDNALLEKQEADRVASGLPWWQDAGHTADVLQMLKNHGVNTVRIRPTSAPPYQTLTLNGTSAVPASCTSTGCYAETDDADIDLAKRAKQLGMAVELTLFFDGGSSQSVPGAWASESLTQLEASVYSYVKSEVEAFRAAGAMPDLVSIGNEVDTGLFGTLASPGSSFSSFAAVEQQGMQAVLDAASDTSLGAAIPPPLRCIHITPAWNLTSFFTEAQQNSIPFDAICQSYYPFFHGPLTSAQAAASNPGNKPVEETVLTSAATSIGVPIFLIEVGEHYESGFDSNDPWYPATVDGQRQFLIDVNSVLKNLPNHLGMGLEYWDPEGVNTTGSGGTTTNGDGQPDATFVWNGLTLFDNADASGTTNTSATNYSAMLSGVDALGGRLDPTLRYKLVNVASGKVLGTAGIAGSDGIPLGLAASDGGTFANQQWTITSDGNGHLILTDGGASGGSTSYALDAGTAAAAGGSVTLKPTTSGASSQQWNLVTASGGEYTLEQNGSGLVLASNTASGAVELEAPASISADWITPMGTNQLWQLVPTRITEQATPSQLAFAAGLPTSVVYGSALGAVSVNLLDATGSPVSGSTAAVTLSLTGPNSFSTSTTVNAANGTATFSLTANALGGVGAYTLTASSAGTTSAVATVQVTAATLTVAAENASRMYGEANPALLTTVTGFVHGDSAAVVSGAAALSTSAVIASAPGSYAISIATGTLAAANYTFALMPGMLTVTIASTSTALSASTGEIGPGQSVTLTATVTSPSTIAPTGTVTFLDAGSTLGNAPVGANGIAVLTTTLQPGVNGLSAAFASNTDFAASTSSTVQVAEADYALATGQNTLTLNAGGNGTVPVTVTPTGGFQGTVTMGCTSTLASLSCTFAPTSFVFSGATAAQTGSVTISASTATAATTANRVAAGMGWASMLLCVPLLGLVRGQGWGQLRTPLVIVLFSAVVIASVSGCGGSGSTAPPPATGTVTVTASSSTGSIHQSVTVSVTIQ